MIFFESPCVSWWPTVSNPRKAPRSASALWVSARGSSVMSARCPMQTRRGSTAHRLDDIELLERALAAALVRRIASAAAGRSEDGRCRMHEAPSVRRGASALMNRSPRLPPTLPRWRRAGNHPLPDLQSSVRCLGDIAAASKDRRPSRCACRCAGRECAADPRSDQGLSFPRSRCSSHHPRQSLSPPRPSVRGCW